MMARQTTLAKQIPTMAPGDRDGGAAVGGFFLLSENAENQILNLLVHDT